jgi:hypothetical protein
MDIVLMANVKLEWVSPGLPTTVLRTHWYSWLAPEEMDMKELPKTVMSMVLGGVSH